MKLLHIDSSPRPGSHSRALSKAFADSFLETLPGTELVRRDLVQTPPPFVDENWVINAFLPEEQREAGALAISDELTDEFLAADVVVLGIPMYNFGLPAVAKAWIDQIMRAGRTFKYGENGVQGLAAGKTIVVTLARSGNYAAGATTEALNFQEPYLRALFGFIGVTDLHVVVLENVYDGDLNFKITERTIETARLAREIALVREQPLIGVPA
jgi:FMN-dependent NADH-azoreductase